MAVEARRYAIGGQDISALCARVETPSALILALHGGGYEARYWHVSEDSDTSLLKAAAALGYDVLAVDRPGYKGSMGPAAAGLSLGRQVDIMFDLIDRVVSSPQLPVFVIGHSMGGILALMMAAHARSSRLAGIDVSGVPMRYPVDMQPIVDRAAAGKGDSIPSLTGDQRRWMFYADDGSYDAGLVANVPGDNPVPMAEMADAFGAPATLPPLMANIALPVQWTIADQERSSVGGREMLDHIRALMPRCPRLLTTLQIASGHNISLHHVARAYHLRALAYFDECRLVRPLG